MEVITFQVQGSAPEPYTTTFSREGNNLTALCTCRAGQVGQYCKHRLNILQGITKAIVSGNERDVQMVGALLKGSDVENVLLDLREAEKRFDEAKKELDYHKKRLARSLRT
jgi:hypothetical protein